MTAKHTKQKYTERQTRLGAKVIKGAYEEVRNDTRLAKEKARPFPKIISGTSAYAYKENEESQLIYEFVPFRKRKRKKIYRKKK